MRALFTALFLFYAIAGFAAQVVHKSWVHLDGVWKIIEIKDDGSVFTKEASFDEALWKNSKYPVLVARDNRQGKEGQFMARPIYAEEKIVKRPIVSHGKKIGTKVEKWLYYRHPKGKWIKTVKVCNVGECVDDKEIFGLFTKTSTQTGEFVYSFDTDGGRLILFPGQVEDEGNLISAGILMIGQALEEMQEVAEEMIEQLQ